MSKADNEGFIWYNGELVEWKNAQTHLLTHSLHYGLACFEGVRAYATADGDVKIFRLDDHTKRLLNSAKILGMQVPFTKEELDEAQKQAVAKNNLPEAYIRPLIFYGAQGMGLRASELKTEAMVAAWEWPSYMSPEKKAEGIKVKVSSYTRHHVNISMTRAKASGHYINSMLALSDALASGCDEALLLDPEGYVAEGSGENVFIVANGKLYTPELTACLDGITRKTIMELAKVELGLEVIEKRITRDEIYIADEAFFTGTAAEVMPIAQLDSRQIGTGARGEITEKLQTLYFDIVTGKNAKYAHWLTSVNS